MTRHDAGRTLAAAALLLWPTPARAAEAPGYDLVVYGGTAGGVITAVSAAREGLKVALRYHFLGASPIFPYVEVTAGAGGTSLNVPEKRSDFTFVLEAGIGLGYFLTDGVQLTAGYRFQHISNGNIEKPNRGFNSDAGVLGVSFFFH